jgi:NADH-quinone oxidoreductase subunit N
MMIIGFGFKVATVPFHVWTPDVYEGAPTPVTAFMAIGTEIGGVRFVFARFRARLSARRRRAGGGLSARIVDFGFDVMAMLTMTVGNIAAIVQNNVKRMLAYSSIAHAGYALVGFIGAGMARPRKTRRGNRAVAFYMLTYAVTNLGAFAIVTLCSGRKTTAARI